MSAGGGSSEVVARCPAFVQNSRRRGEPCGKPVKGFLARGHGRCALHLGPKERLRVLAVIRAERELRELRDLADVERFAGDELAE